MDDMEEQFFPPPTPPSSSSRRISSSGVAYWFKLFWFKLLILFLLVLVVIKVYSIKVPPAAGASQMAPESSFLISNDGGNNYNTQEKESLQFDVDFIKSVILQVVSNSTQNIVSENTNRQNDRIDQIIRNLSLSIDNHAAVAGQHDAYIAETTLQVYELLEDFVVNTTERRAKWSSWRKRITKAHSTCNFRKGWLYSVSANKCFKLHISMKSWPGANDSCTKQGSTLLTIRSSDEKAKILQMVGGLELHHGITENTLGKIWLGLKRSNANSQFLWQDGSKESVPSTNSDTAYSDWYTGYTGTRYGNQRKHCAVVYFTSYSSTWRKENCAFARRFICQINLSK